MVLLRQLSCDGGPDKSGRARDKDLHHASFEIRRRSSPDIRARARQRARVPWNVLAPCVSAQELDLDEHRVVVVLAALVRAIVTAAATVELALWRAISDAQRRTDRRDGVGLGHDQ